MALPIGTKRTPLIHWNPLRSAGRTTWFLRKAAASSLKGRLVCRIGSLRCHDLVYHAADTAFFATRFLFGKLFCVAITFGFGEKRCRKNLPLSAPRLTFCKTFPNATLSTRWSVNLTLRSTWQRLSGTTTTAERSATAHSASALSSIGRASSTTGRSCVMSVG